MPYTVADHADTEVKGSVDHINTDENIQIGGILQLVGITHFGNDLCGGHYSMKCQHKAGSQHETAANTEQAVFLRRFMFVAGEIFHGKAYENEGRNSHIEEQPQYDVIVFIRDKRANHFRLHRMEHFLKQRGIKKMLSVRLIIGKHGCADGFAADIRGRQQQTERYHDKRDGGKGKATIFIERNTHGKNDHQTGNGGQNRHHGAYIGIGDKGYLSEKFWDGIEHDRQQDGAYGQRTG